MKRPLKMISLGTICQNSIAVEIAKPLTILRVLKYTVGVFMDHAVPLGILLVACKLVGQ